MFEKIISEFCDKIRYSNRKFKKWRSNCQTDEMFDLINQVFYYYENKSVSEIFIEYVSQNKFTVNLDGSVTISRINALDFIELMCLQFFMDDNFEKTKKSYIAQMIQNEFDDSNPHKIKITKKLRLNNICHAYNNCLYEANQMREKADRAYKEIKSNECFHNYYDLKTYSGEKIIDLNDDCGICFEKMTLPPGNPVALRCCHVFHMSCVSKWFSEKNTCPTCRQVRKVNNDDVSIFKLPI